MEAALLGRLENVKLLLKHCINKGLRYNETLLVINFTQLTLRSERERHERARGDILLISRPNHKPAYLEDSYMVFIASELSEFGVENIVSRA